MGHLRTEPAFETSVRRLVDPRRLAQAKAKRDGYRASLLPRLLAGVLVSGGTLIYGAAPSYLKFRAVEVIARVPYHAWQAVGFMLMTMFYADEQRALRLAETEDFARIAQDNETMHVVVVSALARTEERSGFLRDTAIPLLFAGDISWPRSCFMPSAGAGPSSLTTCSSSMRSTSTSGSWTSERGSCDKSRYVVRFCTGMGVNRQANTNFSYPFAMTSCSIATGRQRRSRRCGPALEGARVPEAGSCQ